MSDELEPVWTGAHWRTFPQPTITHEPPTPQARGVSRHKKTMRERVLRVVTQQWCSRQAVADQLKIHASTAQDYLNELAVLGHIEILRTSERLHRGSQVLYRRVIR